MKHLLLTLDYELYGDGSGDVFRHIIEPTERILRIAEEHGAKVTIFFEVVEYWRLKEQWDGGNRMGYADNPILAMEKQLREAYRRGHDIQLHLHPQWVNAQWVDGHWTIDNRYWRLSAVPEVEIEELIKRGKQTVEGVIGGGYRCHALRAGGYNIQPSAAVVKAMKACDIDSDSSIYPGGFEQGALSRYDYRQIAADRGFWHCEEELEEESAETGISELPIVAFPVLRLKKYLSLDRVRAIWNNRKSATKAFAAKTETGGQSHGGLRSKIAYFFKHEAQTWDYCLFSKSMHRSFLKQIRRQKNRTVFVLVGHPKSFVSGNGLEYLLRHSHNRYDFPTITEVIQNLGLER